MFSYGLRIARRRLRSLYSEGAVQWAGDITGRTLTHRVVICVVPMINEEHVGTMRGHIFA